MADDNENFIKNAEAAKILGVSPRTLRNWDTNGTLKPHHISPSGYRFYTEKQIADFLKNYTNQNPQTQQKDIPEEIAVELDARKKRRSSKKPLFKIFIDVNKNEYWLDYYVMRSGKTNSLALATSDKLFKKITERVGDREIVLDEGKSTFIEPMHNVSITLNNESLDKLNTTITKAILWIQLSFTNRLGVDHPPDDVIEEARYMKWSVDEYMQLCGLKDRDRAIEKMRFALSVLSKAEIQWEEEIVSRDSQGKPIYSGGYRDKNNKFVPRVKTEKHVFRGSFISTRDLRPVNGEFSYWINSEFARYLAHAGVIAVHKEIFGLNLQKYPNAATLALKFNEYFSMNRGKPQAQKLSVPVLLNSMPHIPKYETLKVEELVIDEAGNEIQNSRNGGNGGWRLRIFVPFVNTLNFLKEEEIISEWHFVDCDSETPKNYEDFLKRQVFFTPGIRIEKTKLTEEQEKC